GQTITVPIMINSMMGIEGWQLSLSWNPSILALRSAAEGSFLSSGMTTFYNTPDVSVVGQAKNAAAVLLGDSSPKSGAGTLITFTFEVIGVGISTLTLSDVLISPVGAVTIGTASISARAVCVEDGNQDGTVNLPDLVAIAQRFGTQQGESRYVQSADLSGDGRIDLRDLILVAKKFGQEC
ncbi:MAG TPA: dockerin type I domain-containing protein, partial [Candidatus Nanoarchaeia archaeon]|nr:dockerin type I domain-containing protein [Candidatus Nanoarchaeia archaeon]